MPKEQLHGSISIIKQRLELAANMGKMRAIKHQMPLIPWSPSVTECASTQMPRDSWPSKPALLYWKRVGPHAKLHQQPKPGDWHGNLIVGLKRELTGTKKPCKDDMCTAWPRWKEQSWETHASLPTPSTGLEPSWSTSHGCPKAQCQRKERERPSPVWQTAG